MKVLVNKKLLKELDKSGNPDLKIKFEKIIKEFPSYFRSPSDFDNHKIYKVHIPTSSNIYTFKIDYDYRLIFIATYDKENELTIGALEIAKHDDYDRKIFRLLNE